MKLGTRFRIGTSQFEVTRLRDDGSATIRPVEPGKLTNGCRYKLGEVVRIVGVDQDDELMGAVCNLEPVQAKVTTPGVFHGFVAGMRKLRKA